jgi:hypothetical protein
LSGSKEIANMPKSPELPKLKTDPRSSPCLRVSVVKIAFPLLFRNLGDSLIAQSVFIRGEVSFHRR